MPEYLTLTLSNDGSSINIFTDKIISFYTNNSNDGTLISCLNDYNFNVKETTTEIQVALRNNFCSATQLLPLGPDGYPIP